MTTAPKPSTSEYGQALRFYSKPWRERHGADMVAMMMDAADHGEDPLSSSARRSLAWSGLCQRFAARPFVWLWTVLVLLSLGIFEWSTFRMVKGALYADTHGTDGFPGLGSWLIPISAALLFLAAITTLTVSMLHLPPLSRRPAKDSRAAGWMAWLALGASLAVPLIGSLFAGVSLAVGIRLYRRTRKGCYRVLAALSAAVVGATALLLLPQVSILLLDNHVE